MRKFDYSFLEFNKIPGNLINVLTSIYSMKSSNDNRKEKFPNIFTELEKIAIVHSVKGSNAIEGKIAKCVKNRVKSVLKSVLKVC